MPRVRYAVRILVWITAALALPVALGGMAGQVGALVGAAGAVVATLWLWLWLPRSAHAAFEAGRFARAARRYRVLGWTAGSAARERSALLSRTGCWVGLGDLARADSLLGGVDDTRLDSSERAVWLNNRACAALEHDPHAALALIDEASALRPDVPALQHTRGMALLAVGRIDDAIAVLDGMRAGGELPPRLEADRCRDLARAWTQKGEAAYAEDYRQRAAAHAR
jgi:predicted Zn-dependent protease